MNPKLKKLAVPGLQWTLGAVVLSESLQLALNPAAVAHYARTGLPQWTRLALAGSEILAGILFLAPATINMGGCALLVIFAYAALLHVLRGQYDIGALAVYGMAVLASMAQRDTAAAEPADDGR